MYCCLLKGRGRDRLSGGLSEVSAVSEQLLNSPLQAANVCTAGRGVVGWTGSEEGWRGLLGKGGEGRRVGIVYGAWCGLLWAGKEEAVVHLARA